MKERKKPEVQRFVSSVRAHVRDVWGKQFEEACEAALEQEMRHHDDCSTEFSIVSCQFRANGYSTWSLRVVLHAKWESGHICVPVLFRIHRIPDLEQAPEDFGDSLAHGILSEVPALIHMGVDACICRHKVPFWGGENGPAPVLQIPMQTEEPEGVLA